MCLECCHHHKAKEIKINEKQNETDMAFFYYYRVASQGQTVNKQYYLKVLECLLEKIKSVGTKKWHVCNDNVFTHSSYLIQDLLVKHGISQACLQEFLMVLTRHGLWFLVGPQNESAVEEVSFLLSREHNNKYYSTAVSDPKTEVLK